MLVLWEMFTSFVGDLRGFEGMMVRGERLDPSLELSVELLRWEKAPASVKQHFLRQQHGESVGITSEAPTQK